MQEVSTVTAPYSPSGFMIDGVFNRTFYVIKQRFGLLFAISAIPNVIVIVFFLAVGFFAVQGLSQSQPPTVGVISTFAIIGFLWILASMVILGAFCYAVYQILASKPVTFSSALAAGFKRLIPLILVSIAAVVLIYIGYILLIIPGIILSCILAPLVPVCMIERPGFIGAFKRCYQLTKGCCLKIFGIIVLAAVGAFIAMLLTMLVLWLCTALLSLVFPAVVGAIFMPLVQMGLFVVYGMFSYALIAVIYHDLRVAKEGISSVNLATVFD